MKYLYIDNLRGIAILMVIIVHSAQKIDGISLILSTFAEYCQMGVQLFFLASAFTLCLSWEKRMGERHEILNFYTRRYCRIAPLYYLGILTYFIINLIKLKATGGSYSQYTIVNVLANLLFVNGFYPPANNNIVPGGWSIGTEMAFYLIFPFLIRFLIQMDKRGYFNASMWPLIGLVISQLFNVTAYFILQEPIRNNNFIYFNLFNQLQVFLLGMFLYFVELKFSLLTNLIGFIVNTIIVIWLWHLNIGYLYSIIPFVAGISFLFLFSAFKAHQLPSSKILGNIGKYSYGMYISHFIFAWYLPQILINPTLVKFLHPNILFLATFLLSVLFSYILSRLLFHYIESPGITFGKRIIHRY